MFAFFSKQQREFAPFSFRV